MLPNQKHLDHTLDDVPNLAWVDPIVSYAGKRGCRSPPGIVISDDC